MFGLGDSSISFWWRRWVEQSRSQRWMALPCLIGQDLDLDVPRVLDVLLEVDGALPKAAFRFLLAPVAGPT